MKIAFRKDLIENYLFSDTNQENLNNKYNVLLESIRVLITNNVIVYDINKKYNYSKYIKNIEEFINEIDDGEIVVILINYKYFKWLFKMLIDNEDKNETFGDAEASEKYITYELINKNEYSKKIYKYINKLINQEGENNDKI